MINRRGVDLEAIKKSSLFEFSFLKSHHFLSAYKYDRGCFQNYTGHGLKFKAKMVRVRTFIYGTG